MEKMTTDPVSTVSRIRPDIITDDFLAILRRHGVGKAYLFGSVVRGEEGPESDLDLLVSFKHPDSSFGEQFLLAEELRKLCGRQVDVLTSVHPAFAPYIVPTLVPLPL
jgi:predicted nucleotidyltransferase